MSETANRLVEGGIVILGSTTTVGNKTSPSVSLNLDVVPRFLWEPSGDNLFSDQGDTLIIDGGLVRRWTDSVSGRVLEAAASPLSERPRYRKATAALNNKPGLQTLASELVDTGNKEDWKFLTNGTGCTIVWAAQPSLKNCQILSNRRATLTGLDLTYNGYNWRLDMGAGAVTTLAANAAGATTTPAGTTHVCSFAFDTSQDSDWEIRTNGELFSGNVLNNPSILPPTYNLTFGAYAQGGSNLEGYVGAIAIYDRWLTLDERIAVEGTMSRYYLGE